MPKALLIDPAILRTPSSPTFPNIPVHAYRTSIAEERAFRGDAKLVKVLRHMMFIREFEGMLGWFKATGAYSSISYAYKGPRISR